MIGVIPEPLATREIAHDGLTELHVVADMHERKALMARRSSAFLTLPGGIGTFEEFFETLSWAALAVASKTDGIAQRRRLLRPVARLLHHGVAERFIRAEHLELLFVTNDAESVVSDLLARVPRGPPKSERF